MFALFSMLGGVVIFVTSFILIRALRKEYEKKMLPWLWSFAIFTMFRFLAFLFFSIVNDLYFGYNITLSFLWLIFSAFSFYGWLVVYSLYIELSDLTRLEDLAHLRVSFDLNYWIKTFKRYTVDYIYDALVAYFFAIKSWKYSKFY